MDILRDYLDLSGDVERHWIDGCKSWGFCKGPQNDLAIPGLSLPYSYDLPFGGNMYLGTSNILPSY